MGGRKTAGSARLIHSRPSKHAPRRGPFAALSEVVRKREPVRESWGGDRRLRKAFPSVTLPADHPFAPYQGFEHNDAHVLGCVRERTRFSLTINHYNVWRLAATVAEDGDAWHRLRDRFPVALQFESVREFRVVQQRQEGDYRILRSSLDGLAPALFDVISLRCVGADDEGRRFSMEINGARLVSNTDGFWAGEITILLECARVSIVESLRQNWIDSVGEASLPPLETLLGVGPIQDWNLPDFEQFIEGNALPPREGGQRADRGSAHP